MSLSSRFPFIVHRKPDKRNDSPKTKFVLALKNFLLLLDFLADPRLRSRVPAKSLGDQIQNKRLTEKEEGKLSIEKNRSQALALKLDGCCDVAWRSSLLIMILKNMQHRLQEHDYRIRTRMAAPQDTVILGF